MEEGKKRVFDGPKISGEEGEEKSAKKVQPNFFGRCWVELWW